MKSLLLLFSFFLLLSYSGKSQIITDSAFVHQQIAAGVLQSSYIFEGEVLFTESYYNSNHDFIYTSNIIKVSQVWKNDSNKPIREDIIAEVITRGGTVGDDMLWISHQIGFSPGQKGMFLCKNSSYPSNPNTSTPQAPKFMLFDGLYFDFDYSQHYISTSYANIRFDCLEKLYEILDPTYIANCLGVDPNPFLYAQRYGELEAFRTQLQQEVTGVNGIVTYTFENAGTVVTDGQEYFEFDIYMSSSVSGFFGLSTIYLDYNTLAFGQNIVQTGGVTVQRGELMPLMIYDDPVAIDAPINNHTLSIIAGHDPGATNLEPIGVTPKQLLHVKMRIDDCNTTPDLSFVSQNIMLAGAIWYDGNNSNTNELNTFLSMVASDVENSTLCGMQITNVSPLVVNAGTGDIVTIDGSNFGASGTVQMKNAEDGGMSWITLDDYDVNWSDTEISITVPSIGPLENTNPNGTFTAGSGPIKIISGNEILETDQTVTVNYAWKNYQVLNPFTTLKAPAVLSGIDLVYDENLIDQDFGYKLIPNTNFSDIDAHSSVIEAMRRWTCETGIRWEFASNENTTETSTEDEISTIRYGTTSSSTRLAETEVRFQRCSSVTQGEEIGFSWAFDIVISDAIFHPFFYDETGLEGQPLGEYDFYSVILHELGHAHMLRHINDENDLMFWELLPNTTSISSQNRKIFFSSSNLEGAIDIMDESLQTSFANCQYNDHSHEELYLSECGTSMGVNKIKNRKNHTLAIYPNPAANKVEIEAFVSENSLCEINVYGVNGEKFISKYNVGSKTGLNQFEIDISELKRGIYLMKLNNSTQIFTSKLIVL